MSIRQRPRRPYTLLDVISHFLVNVLRIKPGGGGGRKEEEKRNLGVLAIVPKFQFPLFSLRSFDFDSFVAFSVIVSFTITKVE